MSDRQVLDLMHVVSEHDDHAADLMPGLDGTGRAVIYLPSLTSVIHYAGVVSDPDDLGQAMCGDMPVQFVVRPQVPQQRVGAP